MLGQPAWLLADSRASRLPLTNNKRQQVLGTFPGLLGPAAEHPQRIQPNGSSRLRRCNLQGGLELHHTGTDSWKDLVLSWLCHSAVARGRRCPLPRGWPAGPRSHHTHAVMPSAAEGP